MPVARRKNLLDAIAVASTSTNGATEGFAVAAQADAAIFYIRITTATAGSIVFAIQTSPDNGANWYGLATSEMTGSTGSLTTTGNFHISTKNPFGTLVRVNYAITTGPFAFTITPCFEKSGAV